MSNTITVTGYVFSKNLEKQTATIRVMNGKNKDTGKYEYLFADCFLRDAIKADKADAVEKDDTVEVTGGFVLNAYKSKDGESKVGLKIFANSLTKTADGSSQPRRTEHKAEPAFTRF